MNRLQLVAAALLLCCCITSLHASSRSWCHCMKTVSYQVPQQLIAKIEVTAPSGRCRRTQVIITRKNKTRLCVNPNAKWLSDLLANLEKKNENINSTVAPALSATTH